MTVEGKIAFLPKNKKSMLGDVFINASTIPVANPVGVS